MDDHSDHTRARAVDGPDPGDDGDEVAARRRRRRVALAGVVLMVVAVSAAVIAWAGADRGDTVVLGPDGRDTGASGDASGDEPGTTRPAGTAVELCRGAGQHEAELIANVEAMDAVYRTRAADMATWRASGAPDDPHTPWRDRPDDQLVAVCIFDAVDIRAPAGPPLEQGEERPPYDKLTVGVAGDGTARLLTAIRTNWPAGKTYTPQEHAPPASERVQ